MGRITEKNDHTTKFNKGKFEKCVNNSFLCDLYIYIFILAVIGFLCAFYIIIHTFQIHLFNTPPALSETGVNAPGIFYGENYTRVYLKKGLKPEPLRNKTLVSLKTVIDNYIKKSEKTFAEDRQHVETMVPTSGTDEMVYYGQDGIGRDWGLYSAIIQAYSNHWGLRTTPDDWWITVVKTVATAIDENSKQEGVRDFFVHQDGKKTLTVIWKGDFSHFYNEMTDQLQSNIKLDGYVDTIRSDFSTSKDAHRIVSELMVMSSMQEYFDYEMLFMCGIPFIDFVGTKEDYENLKAKLARLEQLLKPIEKDIKLGGYWKRVSLIFDKILESMQGSIDVDWWSNIYKMTIEKESFGCGRKKRNVRGFRSLLMIEDTCMAESADLFEGWFITDLLNKNFGVSSLKYLPSGLVSVPLIINNNGRKSNASIVAGIAGLKINYSVEVPFVEAVHGWSLFQ